MVGKNTQTLIIKWTRKRREVRAAPKYSETKGEQGQTQSFKIYQALHLPYA
jgi:hypothetical protein